MLYAHGSDLCHDLELRHAMANCFEAVMGENYNEFLLLCTIRNSLEMSNN